MHSEITKQDIYSAVSNILSLFLRSCQYDSQLVLVLHLNLKYSQTKTSWSSMRRQYLYGMILAWEDVMTKEVQGPTSCESVIFPQWLIDNVVKR